MTGECATSPPEPVKISVYGPEVLPSCTLPRGHKYDHFDEVLNWQWESK